MLSSLTLEPIHCIERTVSWSQLFLVGGAVVVFPFFLVPEVARQWSAMHQSNPHFFTVALAYDQAFYQRA